MRNRECRMLSEIRLEDTSKVKGLTAPGGRCMLKRSFLATSAASCTSATCTRKLRNIVIIIHTRAVNCHRGVPRVCYRAIPFISPRRADKMFVTIQCANPTKNYVGKRSWHSTEFIIAISRKRSDNRRYTREIYAANEKKISENRNNNTLSRKVHKHRCIV